MINFYDKIVIVFFIFLTFLSFPFVILVDADEMAGPPIATIKAKGDIVMTLDLSRNLKPTTVKIPDGEIIIEVKDRKIRVVRAGTPRELCVQRGFIGPGEEVVCLPVKVVVSVSGSAANLPDVTSS